MTEPRDNPWVLVGLVVLGLVAAVAGCIGWELILSGRAL